MRSIEMKKLMGFVMVFALLVFSCEDPNSGTNKAYTEGDVYVSALGVLMHYYFASTPEGIEQAAFDNGISSINPPIKNAPWELNPSLDINVKNAMDSRGASYSAAVYREAGVTYVIVNRKYSGSWYSTLYSFI
jgi:hypothetical protein